jgi:hypothetical protein
VKITPSQLMELKRIEQLAKDASEHHGGYGGTGEVHKRLSVLIGRILLWETPQKDKKL